MAVDFNNGTIFLPSAVVAAEPLSLAIWSNLDFGNTPETLLGVFSTVGGTSYFQLETTAVGNKIFAEKNSVFFGSNSVTSAGTYTPGAWFHGGAIFYDQTNIAVFLGGVKTALVVPAFNFAHALVQSQISGRWFAGAFERPVDGCLAAGGMWNTALSDANMVALAAGAAPASIAPANLVLSVPIGTVATLTNNQVGPALTSSGGPFVQCASAPPLIGAVQSRTFILGCKLPPALRKKSPPARASGYIRRRSGLLVPKGR